jgi:ABC-type transport system substrate-binding protein
MAFPVAPRRLSAVVGVLALALAAAACGGDGGSGGGPVPTTMTIGTTVPLNSMDPIGSTGTSYPFQFLVFDTLIDYDRDSLELKPGLATQWKYETPTRFVLTLRDGVVFSNGEKLDAAAVKASVERYMAKGVLLPLTMVNTVEARGPLELVFNLKYEYASMPELLADCAGMVLAPASLTRFGEKDMGDQPIGTGPYVLKENRPGAGATFAPNDRYWDKTNGAKLSELRFEFFKDSVSMVNALSTGRVDGIVRVQPGDLSAFEGSDKYQVFKRASLGLHTVWFNWENEALKDPLVRQAFNYALDREALNDVLTEGIGSPAYQVWPPSYAMYDKSLTNWTHDPDKARQLLAQAGKAGGVTLNCIYLPGTGWEGLAPVIVEQEAKVGITVKLREVSIAESIQAFTAPPKGTKGADCQMAGFVGYINPGSSLHNLSHSDSFYTPATTDAGLDATIDAFNSAFEPEQKKALSGEWHRKALQAAPMAPVVNRAKIAVLKAGVKGYVNGILTPETFRGLAWEAK